MIEKPENILPDKQPMAEKFPFSLPIVSNLKKIFTSFFRRQSANTQSPQSLNKKIRLIVILTLTFALLIFLVNYFKKEEKPEEVVETPSEVPTPKIEKTYESIYQVKFEVDESKLNLPASLPVYQLSKDPLTEDKITKIAQGLGFTENPYIVEDTIHGTTYLYYSNSGRLRIIPYTKIVDLKNNKPNSEPFTEIPNDEELTNLAMDFLVKNSLVENANNYQLYKINQLSLGPGGHFVDNTKPNLVNVAFVKNADGYPILAPTAETGTVSVAINNQKEITSVYFDDLPDYKKGNSYAVKSYDDIVRESRAKSSIQSIADGKVYLFELKSTDVQSVTINQIEIAYLQENDPEQFLLQPVFLLKGYVDLRSRKDPETVTLYLPAFTSEVQY